MIISDLSHCEEVVCEAPKIVGGVTQTTTSKKLSTEVVNVLPDDLSKVVKNLEGKVTTVKVTKKNGVSSATNATFKKGKKNLKLSASTSSLSS